MNRCEARTDRVGVDVPVGVVRNGAAIEAREEAKRGHALRQQLHRLLVHVPQRPPGAADVQALPARPPFKHSPQPDPCAAHCPMNSWRSKCNSEASWSATAMWLASGLLQSEMSEPSERG